MPDKELICVDCGDKFIYSEAMQNKLQELVEAGKIERVNEPKRCMPCRQEKKQRHRSQGR